MREDKEKAEQETYLGDFRAASPTIRGNKSHNQGKQKTVSRATMKDISVAVHHESD